MAERGKTGLSKVSRYWPGRAPEWAAAANDEEKAHLVSTLEDKHVEDDSSSLRLSYRRRRVRQQPEIVSTAQEEQLLLHHQQLEEEQQEESETEYEEKDSDSDDEQIMAGVVDVSVLLFIPKSQRDTVGLKEEERRRRRRRLGEELDKKRLELRKVQTRQILLEEINKEELLVGNTASTEEAINGVDTDDEVDQAEEHESWQRRDLARIKRSREQSGIDDKATEDDNQSEVADRPKKKMKKQMRFMQRYYHKGCFFQDDADGATQTAGTCEIYRRDFSGPTGLDTMDMSILPKVMQVKHFGQRGGTKWTHLVNQDTTYRNTPDGPISSGTC
ncbi:hypothetical protein E2562_010369 [Oryza meyeriana var. granulata]|uniref:Micro-fibrillar-associated protein 1 C-terminal domain-containing protein n=1 Tax=Oryza meyeriana var. granulata TaxID=110450 RepID=A0A6G1F6B7_9ORYZ|nr:hypothetical protein E2562_010369 [Oryza meyeriana var. granulata]